jgi:hypothetical protein
MKIGVFSYMKIQNFVKFCNKNFSENIESDFYNNEVIDISDAKSKNTNRSLKTPTNKQV